MAPRRALPLLALLAAVSRGDRLESAGLLDGEGGAGAGGELEAGMCQCQLTTNDWNCVVERKLSGGLCGQAAVVLLSGGPGPKPRAPFRAVLKSSDSTGGDALAMMKTEIEVADYLTEKGYAHMPEYYLDLQVKPDAPHEAQLLAMEFLEGYETLDGYNKKQLGEDAFTREVRAAALFLAYEDLKNLKVSHCDFNTGNAMFKLNDPTEVKIIDWGLARVNEPIVGSCAGKHADMWDSDGRPGYLWITLYLGHKNLDSRKKNLHNDPVPGSSLTLDKPFVAPSGEQMVPFSRLSFLPTRQGKMWHLGRASAKDKDANWAMILQHANKLIQAYAAAHPDSGKGKQPGYAGNMKDEASAHRQSFGGAREIDRSRSPAYGNQFERKYGNDYLGSQLRQQSAGQHKTFRYQHQMRELREQRGSPSYGVHKQSNGTFENSGPAYSNFEQKYGDHFRRVEQEPSNDYLGSQLREQSAGQHKTFRYQDQMRERGQRSIGLRSQRTHQEQSSYPFGGRSTEQRDLGFGGQKQRPAGTQGRQDSHLSAKNSFREKMYSGNNAAFAMFGNSTAPEYVPESHTGKSRSLAGLNPARNNPPGIIGKDLFNEQRAGGYGQHGRSDHEDYQPHKQYQFHFGAQSRNTSLKNPKYGSAAYGGGCPEVTGSSAPSTYTCKEVEHWSEWQIGGTIDDAARLIKDCKAYVKFCNGQEGSMEGIVTNVFFSSKGAKVLSFDLNGQNVKIKSHHVHNGKFQYKFKV